MFHARPAFPWRRAALVSDRSATGKWRQGPPSRAPRRTIRANHRRRCAQPRDGGIRVSRASRDAGLCRLALSAAVPGRRPPAVLLCPPGRLGRYAVRVTSDTINHQHLWVGQTAANRTGSHAHSKLTENSVYLAAHKRVSWVAEHELVRDNDIFSFSCCGSRLRHNVCA